MALSPELLPLPPTVRAGLTYKKTEQILHWLIAISGPVLRSEPWLFFISSSMTAGWAFLFFCLLLLPAEAFHCSFRRDGCYFNEPLSTKLTSQIISPHPGREFGHRNLISGAGSQVPRTGDPKSHKPGTPNPTNRGPPVPQSPNHGTLGPIILEPLSRS